MINENQKYNIFKKKNLTEEHIKYLKNLSYRKMIETKNYFYRPKKKYERLQNEGYFTIHKTFKTPYTFRRLKFKNIKNKEILTDILGKTLINEK